jgi:hypothetical protein
MNSLLSPEHGGLPDNDPTMYQKFFGFFSKKNCFLVPDLNFLGSQIFGLSSGPPAVTWAVTKEDALCFGCGTASGVFSKGGLGATFWILRVSYFP